jgi:hypothetical protein
MKEIPVVVEWTANDEGVANSEEQAAVVESRNVRSHRSSEENTGCDLDRRRHQ